MKLFKKLLINFFIIIVLFVAFDFVLYGYLNFKILNMPFELNLDRYIESLKIKNFDNTYTEFEKNNYLRKTISDKKNNKKSILIFGCSFGYGNLLREDQALAYKLSKLTGRNVFNFSVPSLGIQYFPYILSKFNVEKKVFPVPEYIIFVLIDNHIYRLYRYYFEDTEPYKDIRYKIDNGNLVQIINKDNFFQRFVTIRHLQIKYSDYIYNKKSFDENFDFMKLHFLYAKKIANEKFPNAKLVILKYEENYDSPLFNSPRWQELEEDGFIILDSYELTGKHLSNVEYKIEKDFHPNEKAWNILVPKIVQKLNL